MRKLAKVMADLPQAVPNPSKVMAERLESVSGRSLAARGVFRKDRHAAYWPGRISVRFGG